MMTRKVALQIQGFKGVLATPKSSINLLQTIPASTTNLQIREKKNLFPRDRRDKRIPYDLEAEFGRKPGTKQTPPHAKLAENSLESFAFDQPIVIDTVGNILSEYIPLEKKALSITPTGMKQRWEAFKMFLLSTYSLGVIRRHTKSFRVRKFADDAQKTFIEVNMALQNNDRPRLAELVIRGVYAALKHQFLDANQRIYWRFIKTVKPPRVVHARIAPVQEKENLFGQVTVKMHTEQILAITDQHGRKLKGDKKKSKEVIDYVVFERHLVNPYGQWKVIGKIIPPQQIPNSQLITQSQTSQLAQP